MASNGPVDFDQQSNDNRGEKGRVGLGLPENNDFRGESSGGSDSRADNDMRAAGFARGDVMLTPKGRPVD